MAPAPPEAALHLRPATAADAGFLQGVFIAARWTELAATGWSDAEKHGFLTQQADLQARHYAQEFPAGRFDVIEDGDGRRLGRLSVDVSDERLLVIDIALIPAHRGRGIGTRLMKQLMGHASSLGLPVQLTVEAFNPALRWYQRLGFVHIGGDQVYHRMEWAPTPGTPPPQ